MIVGIFLLCLFAWFVIATAERSPAPKRIAPKVVRYKSMIYVLDADSGGVSLYYEWYDRKGVQHRQNTGVVLKLSDCQPRVQELLT